MIPGDGVLQQVQEESKAWRAHNFPNDTANDQLLGMIEELGELSHAELKHKQKIRGYDNYNFFMDEVEDSLADLLIFMCGYANHHAITLEDVLRSTWDKVKQRDFQKYPGNGMNPALENFQNLKIEGRNELGGIGVGPTNELDRAADDQPA